ncbi:hypothetical protein ACOSQ3_011055 [Xanthoceras sorbifolium]
MKATVISYFVDLFRSSSLLSEALGVVVDSVSRRLSAAACSRLDRVFSAEEVRMALFQIAPSKTPGPDGFTAGFYQRFWSVVGSKVSTACLKVLNEGHSVADVNSTLIVLIPKIDRAVKMEDFRPISLYNVIYKAAAILHGIHFACDCGLVPVHVESDSLSAINLLKDGCIPCSDVGSFISDILRPDCVASVLSFSFIPRLANRAADALAKAALDFAVNSFWLESCPSIVEELVQDDRPD